MAPIEVCVTHMENLDVSVRADAATPLMTDLQNFGINSCPFQVAPLPLLTYVAIAKRLQSLQSSTNN